MNKKQILASLNNIAYILDNNNLYQEANILTSIMKRLAKEKYEFFVIKKIQDKYKILVGNAGEDLMPQPGSFNTEREAIEKAKNIAEKDLTDKKPITDKDREESLPAREKIRQILKENNNMNKKQILAQLSKIANELDGLGLHDEADTTTNVMQNLAQEKMPEDAEAILEPMTDIKDAPTQDRVLTYVNRAMADHNAKKDGWITLRKLIQNDPILNRDKSTYLN